MAGQKNAFRLLLTGSVVQPMSCLISDVAGVQYRLFVFSCLILWRHWLEQWLRHTSPFWGFFVGVEVARAVKQKVPANVDYAIVNGSTTSGSPVCSNCNSTWVVRNAIRLRLTGSVVQPMSEVARVESCLMVFRCLILWRHWLEQWLRQRAKQEYTSELLPGIKKTRFWGRGQSLQAFVEQF